MPKIIKREVIGKGLIILETAKGYSVCDLHDWNRNGIHARVIFGCKSAKELRAYEAWLKEIMAGGASA